MFPDSKPSSRMAGLPEPVRVALGLALGYLRWVSLTPMVVVLALFLLMIVFKIYVNFEDSVWDGLERAYEVYREHIGPVAWLEENAETYEQERAARDVDPASQEAVHFTLEDLMPWIMKAWGTIALAAWLVSLARGLLFGPRPRRTLRRKLRILMIAVALGWVMLFVAYFLGSTTYHGSFFGWFALYTASALIVALVSAPILALGHALDALHDQLEPAAPGAPLQR